jgi:hypothetical protein
LVVFCVSELILLVAVFNSISTASGDMVS